VCEVQIFVKFANEDSTCRNYFRMREIWPKHSLGTVSSENQLCLVNLPIAEISVRGYFSSVANEFGPHKSD